MSNAEKMVSVPRQVAEQAACWLEVHSERSSVEYGVDEAIDAAIARENEIPDFTPGNGNKARRRAEALGIDYGEAVKKEASGD